MKSVFVIIIALLILPEVHGQEAAGSFDFGKDTLSDEWFAGPALVYDCEAQHWVCASPFDHADCARTREEELRRGKHLLTCVPATTYESGKQCQVELARLVAQGAYPRLCLHPVARSSFIGFQ